MQLLFKEQVLGTISDISREGFWNYGFFEKTADYSKFTAFFKDIVSEYGFDENKYDKDYLDDQNWYVSIPDGKKEIFIPAIYDDGEIAFRYR